MWMFSEETVSSMMPMTSLKHTTGINWVSNLFPSKLNKVKKLQFNIRFLLSTAMALLKIRLAAFSVFSPNLPKKIWLNCSQTTNTFSGSKRGWFLKTRTNITENSLFLSIAVTIQFKSTKTLIKTQAFGVANFYSERNIPTKPKEGILLILIFKSEA